MKLVYVREGVSRVGEVLQWGAFPVPVPVRGGLLSAAGGQPTMGIALSGWAMVAEFNAARSCCVPVVVPVDESCELVACDALGGAA